MKLDRRIKVSISGIRGEAPKVLTPALAGELASRFVSLLPKGPIVLSRDPRPSGLVLRRAIIKRLLARGRDIFDIGIATLPTTQIATKTWKVAGGIEITASHNPTRYNGLKFLERQGLFVSEQLLAKITQKSGSPSRPAPEGRLVPRQGADKLHIAKILKSLPVGEIKRARLRVALDACNGAGSFILPKLLRQIGCAVVPLACDPTQPFPHQPEPTPPNLGWTLRKLSEKKFDIGIVVDPDADRLVLIDENHKLLSEEITLPLVAKQLYETGRKGAVVVNMSTSKMIDAVAKNAGVQVFRSKVGELNVVNAMRELKAGLGGEGNGGIIDPRVHYGRDSLVATVQIIALLARSKKSLSKLVGEFPRYAMIKAKIPRPKTKLSKLYRAIARRYRKSATANFSDGLRLDFSESWVHLRPSNTEPVFRVIAETKSATQTRKLIKTFSAQVAKFPKDPQTKE